MQSKYNPIDKETQEPEYTEGFLIPAIYEEDRRAEEGARSGLSKNYFVLGSNCAKTVQCALKRAGNGDGSVGLEVNPYNDESTLGAMIPFLIKELVPSSIYKTIKHQNKGKVIKRR